MDELLALIGGVANDVSEVLTLETHPEDIKRG